MNNEEILVGVSTLTIIPVSFFSDESSGNTGIPGGRAGTGAGLI